MQFAVDDAEDLMEPAAPYRELSKASVVSLGLSLSSPLALVFPLGWMLSISAIVLAGVALYSIRINPDQLTGRRLALVALAISTLFTSAAVSNAVSMRWVLSAKAESFAQQWFAHLHDRQPQRAFALTAGFDSGEENVLEWQVFRNDPLVEMLLDWDGGFRARLLQTDEVVAAGNEMFIGLEFAITPGDNSQVERRVRLKLRRSMSREKVAYWRVVDYRLLPNDAD